MIFREDTIKSSGKVTLIARLNGFAPALVSIVLRLAVGGGLAFAALVLMARGLGTLLPEGEQMPVTVARMPAPPEIVMIDLSRGLTYRLTHNTTWDTDPELSADGERVVFASYQNGQAALYIIDLASGNEEQITSSGGYYSLPAWSPDGEAVAFASAYLGETEIYVLNLNDGSLRQLTGGFGPDTHPNWSPDGRYMAYVSGDGFDPADLYVMPVECPAENGMCDMAARQLTDQPGYDWSPAWSPDGKQIAFASDRGGEADIYVMDTACVEAEAMAACVPTVRAMTNEHFTGGIMQVTWSRDGREIRFVSGAGRDVAVYTLEAGCERLPEGCRARRLAVVG